MRREDAQKVGKGESQIHPRARAAGAGLGMRWEDAQKWRVYAG